MSRLAWLAVLSVVLLAVFALHIATKPVDLPSYQQVKTNWKPSYSVALDRNGLMLGEVRTNFSVRRMNWVEFSQLSPAIIETFVRSEDKRFWQHNGADYLALANAAIGNNNSLHKRGGSTITMQLAASLSPINTQRKRRSIFKKINQIRNARKLEKHWTKQQILESWLNRIDFRGEIQGIGAASQLFSAKPASGITKVEALSMAAMLPAPNASLATIKRRACNTATKLDEPVSCDLVAKFINGIGNNKSANDDFSSAYHIRQKLAAAAGERVQSTLDKDLQTKAEQILKQQLARLSRRNVRDGAILVVDNKTGEILVWIGSNPDSSKSPFVDGVTAKRQAGSTLKPHLYALAIENRLLNASSILDDSALQLESVQGIYAPQNYDHQYVGPVSVRYALGSSLNIPAVKALKLVGIEPFMQRLSALGYQGLDQSADYYGFSLALGSIEVSLLEQVQAYRTIANAGEFSKISYIKQDKAKTNAVISKQAAFITSDMLADANARQHTFGRNSVLDLPFPAAVKTGTSKAMRDNWAIGFTPEFTVGVWVGNFEGDPMTGVSGTSGAAPIWNRVMRLLHQERLPAPMIIPAGIVVNQVSFVPQIEQQRSELFLQGLQRNTIQVMTKKDMKPSIIQPIDGTIIALDPDIPEANQLIRFAIAGKNNSVQLVLNGKNVQTGMLWHPVAGKHKLQIVDQDKNIIDQVSFSVR
ncbi:MAG: penicillin-binding protein 1C [Robiginitomaculum sp.]|nr:penicillin-binding protein 1C [Robiginitomaculum sp.]